MEEQGEIKALRGTLLRLGRQRFGPADEATTTILNGIADLERLKRMTDRLLQARTWQEVLATP